MSLYKIAILGDPGVGKTSLAVQEGCQLPIEDSYRKQIVLDDKVAILEIIDTPGQEEFEEMRSQYIRSAEGFVLVFSISSRPTFEHIERFRDQIFRVKGEEKAPLVLVGNKSDLVTSREVTREEGTQLAKQLKCEYVEASAKTCVNVERFFYNIARLIRDRHTVPEKKEKKKEKKTKTKFSKLTKFKECKIL